MSRQAARPRNETFAAAKQALGEVGEQVEEQVEEERVEEERMEEERVEDGCMKENVFTCSTEILKTLASVKEPPLVPCSTGRKSV